METDLALCVVAKMQGTRLLLKKMTKEIMLVQMEITVYHTVSVLLC